MEKDLESVWKALADFRKVQKYMALAKRENAAETLAELEEEYLSLRTFLNFAGVDLEKIDKMGSR